MMSKAFFIAAGAAAALGVLTANPSRAAEEINALVWCDHTDPALVDPFTTATGIKVNLKEYEGTGAALAILEQSQPGDWDVMVVDSTDVKRVSSRGLLAALDPANFPVADIPEAVWAPKLHEIEGTLRAVPEKFGYNGIAFDRNVFSDAQAKSSATLFDPANKEKIAIYDYYLPIITKIAILVGKDPAKLTEADLPAIKEKLFALKENSALVAEVVSSQTALATGEVGMVIGGGEYTVSGLHAEKPNLDWQLLDEGDVRWQQAIAVLEGSTKKEAATKFLQYILSPEGQARLATSSCYWAMPANTKATLTDEQKKVLRWDEQPGFIAKSHLYISPTEEFDQALQSLWTEFLQH